MLSGDSGTNVSVQFRSIVNFIFFAHLCNLSHCLAAHGFASFFSQNIHRNVKRYAIALTSNHYKRVKRR